MREIVERETFDTSHANGKSVFIYWGEAWILDRKAMLCLISGIWDALLHLQVNISFFCWKKLQGNVAALAVL